MRLGYPSQRVCTSEKKYQLRIKSRLWYLSDPLLDPALCSTERQRWVLRLDTFGQRIIQVIVAE